MYMHVLRDSHEGEAGFLELYVGQAHENCYVMCHDVQVLRLPCCDVSITRVHLLSIPGLSYFCLDYVENCQDLEDIKGNCTFQNKISSGLYQEMDFVQKNRWIHKFYNMV